MTFTWDALSLLVLICISIRPLKRLAHQLNASLSAVKTVTSLGRVIPATALTSPFEHFKIPSPSRQCY